MSKSKKNRSSKSIEVKKAEKPESIGPFTVVVDVYGPKLDAMGRETPHVDPKNHVRCTVVDNRLAVDGGSVQGALNSLTTFHRDAKGKKVYDPLPYYQIVSVTDHGKVGIEQVPYVDTSAVEVSVEAPEDVLEELLPEDFMLGGFVDGVEASGGVC